jgi:hypothetical protein
MFHRQIIGQFAKEVGFFAYLPLGILAAKIDTNAVSQMITCAVGAIVGAFAIRYYWAQTRKSEVERSIAEIELKKLQIEKALKTRKPKKKDDDDE